MFRKLAGSGSRSEKIIMYAKNTNTKVTFTMLHCSSCHPPPCIGQSVYCLNFYSCYTAETVLKACSTMFIMQRGLHFAIYAEKAIELAESISAEAE